MLIDNKKRNRLNKITQKTNFLNTMKAIGYIRVSTSDQDNSTEVQENKIQEYCKFKGFELIKICKDIDISGGTEFYKRKGGIEANEMLTGDVKLPPQ